jgi:hypothetical protein
MQALQDGIQFQISTLEQDRARDITSLTSRVEKGSQRIWQKFTELTTDDESRKITITEIQQRAGAQDLRLTDLFRLVQEEITTRQALTDEMAKKAPRPKKAQS